MATTPPVPIYNQGPSVTRRNLPPQYDPNAAFKTPPATGGVDVQGDTPVNGGFYDRWRANRLPPRPRTVLQPGGGQMPVGVKPLPDPTVRLGLDGGYLMGPKGQGGGQMGYGDNDQYRRPEGPGTRGYGGMKDFVDWNIPTHGGGNPGERWGGSGNFDHRMINYGPGGPSQFNAKGEAARGNWGGGEMSPEEEEYYRQQMAHNSGMQPQGGQQQGAPPQQGQGGGGRAPLRPGMQYRPGGGQRPIGGGMQAMIPHEQGQVPPVQQMPVQGQQSWRDNMRPGFYGAW